MELIGLEAVQSLLEYGHSNLLEALQTQICPEEDLLRIELARFQRDSGSCDVGIMYNPDTHQHTILDMK
jgi:hypothetical protein